MARKAEKETQEMKSFKQYISEEWIDNTKKMGDLYKNPSPSEWKDYVKQVGDYGVAGLYHKGNVYLFSGESAYHEHVIKTLGIPNDTHTVCFRGSLTRGKKINEIDIGGFDARLLRAGKKDINLHAKYYTKLYNHKSLRTHMAHDLSTTITDIISWMGDDEFTQVTGVQV